MDAGKVADFLKDEYIMLQTLYGDMDQKGLTIKNWAITVTLAIIGASFVIADRNLLWLAMAASIIFWYLEAYWRGLSHFFAVRIREIEAPGRRKSLCRSIRAGRMSMTVQRTRPFATCSSEPRSFRTRSSRYLSWFFILCFRSRRGSKRIHIRWMTLR